VACGTEIDLLALEIGHSVGPVGDIDVASVRVDMNCPRELPRLDVAWRRQRVLAEQRLQIERVVLQLIDMELVLALERDVRPLPARVKIEMSRSEPIATSSTEL